MTGVGLTDCAMGRQSTHLFLIYHSSSKAEMSWLLVVALTAHGRHLGHSARQCPAGNSLQYDIQRDIITVVPCQNFTVVTFQKT